MPQSAPTVIERDRRSRSIILVAIIALAAFFGAFIAPSVASAEQNPNIKVETTDFTKSSETGEPSDGAVYKFDYAKYAFTWDASNANPKPGDSFVIEFPKEFALLETITIPLRASGGGEAGECVVGDGKATCTFNEAVVGKTNIKGSGEVILEARETTESNTVEFNLNGETKSVPLPDNQPIGVRERQYEPIVPPEKWAENVCPGDTEIDWQVAFNAGEVLKDPEQQADSVTITIVDTLSSTHSYETDLSKWQLMGHATKTQPQNLDVLITDATGADQGVAGYESLKLDVKIEGNKATITITGSLNPDANYAVDYSTIPSGGSVKPGVVYSNSADVQGKTVTQSTQYIQTFKITVEMEDGFGAFDVTKLIQGDGASLGFERH